MQVFDIVIIGGGIVGLALACGLHGSGLRVAIVEQQELENILSVLQPELRFVAINVASRHLLQYIQVWEDITARCVNAYSKIEVWERNGFGHISFEGIELGYPELGYIIENKVIQQTLWHRVKQLLEVTIISPATLCQIIWGQYEAVIILDDNRMLTTKLIVAADGAHSLVCSQANIMLFFWDYQHHALVAKVRTALPHSNIARQAFHSNGILAFLPLSDPYLSSIIWSLPPLVAQEQLIAPIEIFNKSLAINFNLELGLCELQSERQVFPLVGRYANNFAAHRLVLIGDAAHTVHPLAGQGINLGLMDVAFLLGEIRRLQKANKDIGHYFYLQHYERNRKQSAAMMLASIQGFHDIFHGQNPLKKLVRNACLRLVDMLPGIKLCCIKHAMGINDLPSWLVLKQFN